MNSFVICNLPFSVFNRKVFGNDRVYFFLMCSHQNSLSFCQVLVRLTKPSNLRGEFLFVAYSISFTKSKLCDKSFFLVRKTRLLTTIG